MLSAEITHALAAEVIANPLFPSRSTLPNPLPLPFDNFGHLLLVDYERLVNIVWRVALDARNAAAGFLWKTWYIPTAIMVTCWWLVLLGALGGGPFLAGCLLAFGAVGIMGLLKQRRDHQAHRAINSIRVMALEALLTDKFDDAQRILTISPNHIGTGALGGSQVPVLITNSDSMFPGFGKLQLENTFVTGPKEGQRQSDANALTQTLMARVRNEISAHPGILIRDGEVVVVHRDSICRDSAWLNQERAPKLWLARADLANVHAIDPRASARVFHAIQIMLPSHAAIVTFFLRVFPAGNGVSLQIAAATLGPPTTSKAQIAAHLFKYRQAEVAGEAARLRGAPTRPLPSTTNKTANDASNRLHRAEQIRLATRAAQDIKINLNELMELNVQNELIRDAAYNTSLQRTIDDNPYWPGTIFEAVNLREQHSFSLPPDFFGGPEMAAQLSLLYGQITRTALKAVEAGGFDISEYQDNNGRFLIQAGKIDQLVMGEQVDMHDHRPAASTQHTANPATMSAARQHVAKPAATAAAS